MDRVNLIGMIAAVCTTISFFPQVVKVYRTKHTKDLSFPMYIIFSTGTFLWLLYGVMLKSNPIILANAVTLISCVYILSAIIRYK